MATKTTNIVYPNTATLFNEKHISNISLLVNLSYHSTDWATEEYFKSLFNGKTSEGIASIVWYPLDLLTLLNNSGLIGDYEAVRIGTRSYNDDNDRPVRGWKMKRGSLCFDVGSVTLSRFFNNFLDFSGYTKIKAWLPYIGFVDLVPEELYGRTIKFRYTIDFEIGNCTCFIEDDTKLIKSANGQIGVKVPIGSSSIDGRINGIISGSIGMASGLVSTAVGAVTANPIAIAGGVTSTINSAVGTINNMKPDIRRGEIGAMSTMVNAPQQVYLIIERPIVSYSDYSSLYGLPLGKMEDLSDMTGFTKIEEVHLEDMRTNDAEDYATETELDEIESLLKAGVIL